MRFVLFPFYLFDFFFLHYFIYLFASFGFIRRAAHTRAPATSELLSYDSTRTRVGVSVYYVCFSQVLVSRKQTRFRRYDDRWWATLPATSIAVGAVTKPCVAALMPPWANRTKSQKYNNNTNLFFTRPLKSPPLPPPPERPSAPEPTGLFTPIHKNVGSKKNHHFYGRPFDVFRDFCYCSSHCGFVSINVVFVIRSV